MLLHNLSKMEGFIVIIKRPCSCYIWILKAVLMKGDKNICILFIGKFRAIPTILGNKTVVITCHQDLDTPFFFQPALNFFSQAQCEFFFIITIGTGGSFILTPMTRIDNNFICIFFINVGAVIGGMSFLVVVAITIRIISSVC